MAYFDRAVPPGGEGKITLRFNTRGYEGRVRKAARVYTNDPANRRKTLTFQAFVKTPILVSPRSVFIQGKATETLTRSVDITADLAEPLKIEPIDFNLNHGLKYHIEEVSPGKHYRIDFTTIPSVVDQYRGRLLLKTNYPKKSQLAIFVRVRLLN